MTDEERDLMRRYIYQVVRRLPREQREETAMELEELITDIAAQKGMEAALEELGDPAVFAGKYREEPGWVIGPEYYEDYFWLLKIVLGAVAISAVVSGLVQGLMQKDGTRILAELLSTGLTGGIGAVGAVTILFMILERRKIRIDFQREFRAEGEKSGQRKAWLPMLLPPVPDSKAVIKRSDCAVNLIFETLLAGLMIFAPWLFGIYVFEDGSLVRTIPILNLEAWDRILPVLLISLAAGFADDVTRLICGRYCRTVLTACLIGAAVQAVFAWILLKTLPFFNQEFVLETKWDLLALYGTELLENLILLLIWICILIEAGVTVYKTVRYAENRVTKTVS